MILYLLQFFFVLNALDFTASYKHNVGEKKKL